MEEKEELEPFPFSSYILRDLEEQCRAKGLLDDNGNAVKDFEIRFTSQPPKEDV
jgi:hypothetical protein